MDRKAIVLLSGGIDSVVLLAHAVKRYGADNVAPITFMYGQRAIHEVSHVNEICAKFGVQKTHFINLYGAFKHDCCLINTGIIPDEELQYGDIWELPLRNVVFSSLAASNACTIFEDGSKFDILIGMIKPEPNGYIATDCTPEFIKAMNLLLEATTGDFCRMVTPLAEMTKDEVIEYGVSLGVPFELTYSCYMNGKVPCGKCGGCLDRQRAFEKLEIQDPYFGG